MVPRPRPGKRRRDILANAIRGSLLIAAGIFDRERAVVLNVWRGQRQRLRFGGAYRYGQPTRQERLPRAYFIAFSPIHNPNYRTIDGKFTEDQESHGGQSLTRSKRFYVSRSARWMNAAS